MGLPRSKYVQEGQEGVYHCFARCVRRAFLCGYDPVTNHDYSHRKIWLVDRLRYLAATFAIEVCAYAIMENHYHSILRTRPDIVMTWSAQEVATRWLTLFPPKQKKKLPVSLEEEINKLAARPERIEELRKRLCSLSWFMGRLNEHIARAANKEDKVKGRFWESRFKCQALLDEAAIVGCMAYVDLNPIRAGISAIPEDSDFTSIQERIRTWQKEAEMAGAAIAKLAEDIYPESTTGDLLKANHSSGWLCPIQSYSHRRGILQMSQAEYFDLVDRSGRILRSGKRGTIDEDLAPILVRIGAIPQSWFDTISAFGSGFMLAAGRLSNLRDFAGRLGKSWFKGVDAARSAFAS
jgi:REP element-mobilizing transposase RayT